MRLLLGLLEVDVDWNRPVLVAFGIMATIIMCFVIANLHKWLK